MEEPLQECLGVFALRSWDCSVSAWMSPCIFIKESMLAAALDWFLLGMLKLFWCCVHSSLAGSIQLHLFACRSFVFCMGSQELVFV
jgi:hypothetical protein